MTEAASSFEEPSGSQRRSIQALLRPLELMASESVGLTSDCGNVFDREGRTYSLPRYVYLGPRGGGEILQIGIFATIYGDEPEGAYGLIEFIRLLTRFTDVGRGYCLFVYPICNPTGYEDGTKHARGGANLGTEFWRDSREPEIHLLENELTSRQFNGIICLRSNKESDGVYGYAGGSNLTKHLLEPALQAASEVLPLNEAKRIDGHSARNGIIRQLDAQGALRAPPKARPKPFEITLEMPQAAPQYLQHQAIAFALASILVEYQKLIAYAADL